MKTRRAKYKSLSPPQQHGCGDSAAEEIISNSGAVEADSTSPEREIIETIREEFNGEEHATAGVMGIEGDSFNGDDVAGGDDGSESGVNGGSVREETMKYDYAEEGADVEGMRGNSEKQNNSDSGSRFSKSSSNDDSANR